MGNIREKQHHAFRPLSSSLLTIAFGAFLAIVSVSGCGGSATDGGPGKAISTDLESAKQSLATPAKVRGKTLPADANLSARERRALKQEGQLPTK
jgi:hypothetical protein